MSSVLHPHTEFEFTMNYTFTVIIPKEYKEKSIAVIMIKDNYEVLFV